MPIKAPGGITVTITPPSLFDGIRGLVLKYTVCVTETMAVLSSVGRKKKRYAEEVAYHKRQGCHVCTERSVAPASYGLAMKPKKVLHSGSYCRSGTVWNNPASIYLVLYIQMFSLQNIGEDISSKV